LCGHRLPIKPATRLIFVENLFYGFFDLFFCFPFPGAYFPFQRIQGFDGFFYLPLPALSILFLLLQE
jgi:hypothetical protein